MFVLADDICLPYLFKYYVRLNKDDFECVTHM